MARNQFMSSSNPFVSESTFAKNSSNDFGLTRADSNVMTVQGTVNKSIILAVILIVSAIVFGKIIPYSSVVFYASMFGALGIAMMTYRSPKNANILAPLFAVVEGILVGTVSYYLASFFDDPSIVFNALLLTILSLISMLGAYKFGLIKPTEKFRSVITTATGAIMMIYLISMGLRIFNINIPYLHEANAIGIGISLFIISIASLKLILDFDNIERGVNSGAPKYMEWASSVGLLMTLVWIYIEILYLLAMFASND